MGDRTDKRYLHLLLLLAARAVARANSFFGFVMSAILDWLNARFRPNADISPQNSGPNRKTNSATAPHNGTAKVYVRETVA